MLLLDFEYIVPGSVLLLAWMTTAGQERVYLSDRKFQKLSLNIQCDIHVHALKHQDNMTTSSHCAPDYDEYDDDHSLTPTSVLFDMFGSGTFGKSSEDDSQESATSFVTLLGNLMMNGTVCQCHCEIVARK